MVNAIDGKHDQIGGGHRGCQQALAVFHATVVFAEVTAMAQHQIADGGC